MKDEAARTIKFPGGELKIQSKSSQPQDRIISTPGGDFIETYDEDGKKYFTMVPNNDIETEPKPRNRTVWIPNRSQDDLARLLGTENKQEKKDKE